MKNTTLLGLAIAICCIWQPVNAQLPAPKILPFQGRLTDQNGIAVSNGVRLVQFKIYDVPTGGSPVWAGELHRTTVNGGLVNVLLGSKTPFTGVDFDKQLYLEITVDINADSAITLADPPMLPRQVILPVVFAKEAADSRLLDGHDWSAILVNSATNPVTGSIRADKLQPQGITADKISPSAITSALIAPGAVLTSDIGDGQITAEKLSPSFALDTVIPPGSIQAFGGANAPGGWLLCDGMAFSSNSYPRLFAALDTSWGSGYTNISGVQIKVQGADFNVPDLRGVFLRGRTGNRADGFSDPDFVIRTNAFTGGAVGNNVGSVQGSTTGDHTHGGTTATKNGNLTAQVWVNGSGNVVMRSDNMVAWSLNGTWAQAAAESSAASQARGAIVVGATSVNNEQTTESRPANAYVHYIIKY